MGAGSHSIGFHALRLFAPVLVLTGVAGFLLPPAMSLMSGAPAYNVFHLVFGAIGIGAVVSRRERAIAAFNLGFGALDLYQAVASWLHLFPADAFRWKPADDVLHVVLGVALVALGLLGWKR